jgi:hypothetical protein
MFSPFRLFRARNERLGAQAGLAAFSFLPHTLALEIMFGKI